MHEDHEDLIAPRLARLAEIRRKLFESQASEIAEMQAVVDASEERLQEIALRLEHETDTAMIEALRVYRESTERIALYARRTAALGRAICMQILFDPRPGQA